MYHKYLTDLIHLSVSFGSCSLPRWSLMIAGRCTESRLVILSSEDGISDNTAQHSGTEVLNHNMVLGWFTLNKYRCCASPSAHTVATVGVQQQLLLQFKVTIPGNNIFTKYPQK